MWYYVYRSAGTTIYDGPKGETEKRFTMTLVLGWSHFHLKFSCLWNGWHLEHRPTLLVIIIIIVVIIFSLSILQKMLILKINPYKTFSFEHRIK